MRKNIVVRKSRVPILVWICIVSSPSASGQQPQDVPVPEFPFLPPTTVSVFPIFFVAADQPNPTLKDGEYLMRHLAWAQQWFKKELKGRSTFSLFSKKPYLFRGQYPLAHYVGQDRGKRAPVHLNELLEHFQMTRFNCPFVFVMIVDKLEERPNGGRPINAGFNGGGGIVQMSRKGVTSPGPFQTLLRHELGHSFGLQHVTLYDYDMKTNRSIMSYNQANNTKAFQESRIPALLIPEDIRALALNDRVFPNLEFDKQRDVPRGYEISAKIAPISPMVLPGRPADRVKVVSRSGDSVGSKAMNLVRRKIVPNERSTTHKLGINYDPGSMWHSDDTGKEWRTLEVTFPVETRLTGIRVHSQHSGRVHPVEEFRISTLVEDVDAEIARRPVNEDNQLITFKATASLRWKLDFKPGKSKKVALRGLQFYFNDTELFAAVTTDADADPVEEK